MHILEHEPMSRHTTFRVGGPARLFLIPETEEEVARAVKGCTKLGLPFNVIGRGSNLLVSDAGYQGVVIQIGDALAKTRVSGTTLCAQAGITLASVFIAKFTVPKVLRKLAEKQNAKKSAKATDA